nr:MAG TPA: portal [Caudoviricetes sp.]
MNIINNLFAGIPGTSAYREKTRINLVKELAEKIRKNRNVLVELNQQTDSLTKKDIATWRRAWQAAIDYEQPNRCSLYDVYTDAMIDLHLTGCIAQRKGKTLQKPFILMGKNGKEDDKARAMFEREWFIDFVSLALDSPYWGHSLIQFNDIVDEGGVTSFSGVELVPRKHVVPEYGVITREAGDDWKTGISYRDGDIAAWCIEVGHPRDLGLLLKCAPQSLSKKNMLAYWDTFGEIFGMPMRIGKTISQDPKDIARIEKMLDEMGAASWGLFPEGTDIEIKESTRGDAYNVYDKRIDRCNSEISKGILGQTMTIDNGSSLSQSETHLEVFENICRADATMIKYLINDRLIPLMIRHGFPLQGVTFDWDEATSYTPAEQREIERLLIQYYDIDPQYFADKYKIAITGVKQPSANSFFE